MEKLIQTQSPPISHTQYALCYFLGEQEWYRKEAIKYCQQFNIKLIWIPATEKDFNRNDTSIIGPTTFLQLIYNARYVFTDSFHGLIFLYYLNVTYMFSLVLMRMMQNHKIVE